MKWQYEKIRSALVISAVHFFFVSYVVVTFAWNKMPQSLRGQEAEALRSQVAQVNFTLFGIVLMLLGLMSIARKMARARRQDDARVFD